MPGLGVGHWWLIAIVLVIVLIIWGPGKLPDVGSGLGRAIREFRKASSETRDEFAKATRHDETPAPPATPTAGTGPVATPATIPPATTPLAQPAPVGAGAPETLPTERAAGEGDHTTAG